MDIVLSLVAIAVLLIPGLVIILTLKLTGDKQAFFFQPRIGIGKQEFTCWKLVTMRSGSEKTGTGAITIKNDPRVTPLGKFLRKTKINELPQFVNVLKGDMSLVGPRPLTPEGFDFYAPDVQDEIGKVKPGLTGIGSIVFRDEEQLLGKTDKPFETVYREDISPYKGALEEWYIKRQSVWLDIKLLFLTVVAVVVPGSTLYTKWLRGLPDREDIGPNAVPRKKRVLIMGGASDQMMRFRAPLIEHILAQGHDVAASCGEITDEVVQWMDERGVRFYPVELSRRGIEPIGDYRYYKALRAIFRDYRPDMIFSATIKPNVFGAAAATAETNARFCAMVEGAGSAFSEENPGLKTTLIRRAATFLYRRAMRFIDVTFFLNQDDVDLFKDLGITGPADETCVIDGIGLNLVHYQIEPPFTDPPTFLLISRLIYEKGIREYAAAAKVLKAKHPRARFQLLGAFEVSGEGMTEAEVQEWVDGGYIDYLGVSSDVRVQLRETSVFVLPSYYREGKPRTIMEAMSMSRPVITADSPGCREMVVDGEEGYVVPPHDVPSLVEAMEKFIVEPELIGVMGERGRHTAEERFDVDKINQQILEVLLDQHNAAMSPEPVPAGVA